MRQSKQEQTDESNERAVEKPIIAIEGIDDYMNTVQTRMVYEYLLRKGYTHKNGYNIVTSTGVPVTGNNADEGEVRRKNKNLMRGLDGFFKSEKPIGILVANGYLMQTLTSYLQNTSTREKAPDFNREETGAIESDYNRSFPQDITFLIDVNPRKAADRMNKMRHSNGIPSLKRLKELRSRYLRYGRPNGLVVISGSGSEQRVFARIAKHLESLFPDIGSEKQEKQGFLRFTRFIKSAFYIL